MALIFRFSQAAGNNNDLFTVNILKMINNVCQKSSSPFLRIPEGFAPPCQFYKIGELFTLPSFF
jgi:hypothetical protein